jgi:hypothetical protein
VDPGRQRLSQRRKAAALTHGSRTDLLAPELSTVIRQETGNAEPPPPKRPNVASARQVSMGQFADLFTESKTDATGAPATNGAEPNRALIRPRAAAKPELPEPMQIQHPYRPSRAATPARSWRLKRFPAAGLLAAALAGGAASVVMGPPHGVPVPPDAAGAPTLTAPIAAVPVADPAVGNTSPTKDVMGAGQPAPATKPAKPVESTTSSRANTVPSAPDAQSVPRPTIRHQPPAPTVTAPSSHRPTPAEAYEAWARAAGFNGNDRHWPDVRPEPEFHR